MTWFHVLQPKLRIAIVAIQRAPMAPSAIGFCDLLGTPHAPVLKKVSFRRILLALDSPTLEFRIDDGSE